MAFEKAPPDSEAHHDEKVLAQPEAIAETLEATGGRPDPFGRGHIKLYLCCLIIYFCSTMNGMFFAQRKIISNVSGYDGSLMGSINVLREYQDYYNIDQNQASTTGLVFSIFQIGQMVGALFTWICDWQGRKWTLVISASMVVVSAIFTAVAPTLPSFIAARFLLSFFSTINTVVAPVLLVEIAPPLHRATVAGIYNTLYYMGSIIATFGK